MESGPSKEQIDNFYRTSRKYFDELARHYYEKDKDFYIKYFAPYYTNPLYSSSKGIPNLKARLILMVFLVLIAGLIFGLTYLLQENSEHKRLNEKRELLEGDKSHDEDVRMLLDSVANMDSIIEKLGEPLIVKEKNNGAKSVKRKANQDKKIKE